MNYQNVGTVFIQALIQDSRSHPANLEKPGVLNIPKQVEHADGAIGFSSVSLLLKNICSISITRMSTWSNRTKRW
jgi:hypothetical protein